MNENYKKSVFEPLFGEFFQNFIQETEILTEQPVPAYKLFFPDRQIVGTSFKTLIGSSQKRIAATITGFGSAAPLRGDQALNHISHDTFPIQHGKQRGENELLQINTLKALGTPGEGELVDMLFDDVTFAFNGVQVTKDIMAHQLLSTGKVELTETLNNEGLKGTIILDYQLATWQRKNASVDWATVATAKPLDDINAVVEQALANGVQVSTMLMTKATFNRMKATDNMKIAVFQLNSGNTVKQYQNVTPTLAQINEFLEAQLLPTIVLVDDKAMRQNSIGNFAQVEIWKDGVVTFVTTLNQGRMNNTLPIEVSDAAYSQNANVAYIDYVAIIKKNGTNPPTEITIGKGIAGIEWNQAGNVLLLSTKL